MKELTPEQEALITRTEHLLALRRVDKEVERLRCEQPDKKIVIMAEWIKKERRK